MIRVTSPSQLKSYTMKTLLAIVLFFCSLAAHAAADLSINYTGPQTVMITNTGNCVATVRLKWDGNSGSTDTTFVLGINAGATIQLPGLAIGDRVRAKSDNPCSSGSGWKELTISQVLAVMPAMTAAKHQGTVMFRLSTPGIIEKSTNGTTFFPLGSFEQIGVDRSPGPKNYYRLKADGQLSAVCFVQMNPGTVYQVFNPLGQFICETTNVTRYQAAGFFTIAKE